MNKKRCSESRTGPRVVQNLAWRRFLNIGLEVTHLRVSGRDEMPSTVDSGTKRDFLGFGV